ncbi:DUF1345 domain-containing protein [Aquincola sp. MAHUQ-54]|uniref:DUF1345 domain-containing protein n=1 Tax=Aquincola agrisoli TaxID=3119538 RepID=A0AAW9Q7Z8_9BURK
MLRHLRAHPRLLIGIALGSAAGWLLPSTWNGSTRTLAGWNAGTWFYLASTWLMMLRSTHDRLRNLAVAHAEGAPAVMSAAVCAVVFTLAAIVLELSRTRQGADPAWPHVALTLVTLLGSWLLLATLFALSYASLYYRHRHRPGHGLHFPGTSERDPPTYGDFLYFSFTLAATSQTSDVAVLDRNIRRWVLAQAVLSFLFNTVLLALAINTAAGLF